MQDLALHPKRRSPGHLQLAQPAPARAGSSQLLSGMSFKGLLTSSPSLADPSAADAVALPSGRIRRWQLAPPVTLAPPDPPSASHTTSPAPLLALLGTSSELGGLSICLRLRETSSGR